MQPDSSVDKVPLRRVLGLSPSPITCLFLPFDKIIINLLEANLILTLEIFITTIAEFAKTVDTVESFLLDP